MRQLKSLVAALLVLAAATELPTPDGGFAAPPVVVATVSTA
jgi:hypothetical protein